MSWTTWLQQSGTHLLNWITRRRRTGRVLLSAGAAVLVATLAGGWSLSITQESASGRFVGWLSAGEGLPLELLRFAFWLGGILIVIGAILLLIQVYWDAREARRSAVIVIELRGLVDTGDRTLLKSVPWRIRGARLDAHVDVRTAMATGAHAVALHEIEALPHTIRRLRAQRERAAVQLVAGGVLQVPFLFYAGVVLDDEGDVLLMDWDRKAKQWGELVAPDDGERFVVSGMLQVPSGTQRVVLAVSASYRVDEAAILATFGSQLIVRMSLERPLPDTLWSAAKQTALTAQFLETLAELGNRGVTHVDLVLVAPASLAVRMGQAYDRRNLPTVRCYQYEKNATPPYPWAVEIDGTHGTIKETHPLAESVNQHGG